MPLLLYLFGLEGLNGSWSQTTSSSLMGVLLKERSKTHPGWIGGKGKRSGWKESKWGLASRTKLACALQSVLSQVFQLSPEAHWKPQRWYEVRSLEKSLPSAKYLPPIFWIPWTKKVFLTSTMYVEVPLRNTSASFFKNIGRKLTKLSESASSVIEISNALRMRDVYDL